jgi:hypothetical protein
LLNCTVERHSMTVQQIQKCREHIIIALITPKEKRLACSRGKNNARKRTMQDIGAKTANSTNEIPL